MGKAEKKKSKEPPIQANSLGWQSSSPDGDFLMKLINAKKVTAATPPGYIRENWPQFQKYKHKSFAAGLRYLKNSLNLNVRGGSVAPAAADGTLSTNANFVIEFVFVFQYFIIIEILLTTLFCWNSSSSILYHQ